MAQRVVTIIETVETQYLVDFTEDQEVLTGWYRGDVGDDDFESYVTEHAEDEPLSLSVTEREIGVCANDYREG